MTGVVFGATILAAATSLPEVSTGIAAVRLGDYQLAVSDIFGGNAFLPVLFLLAGLLSGSAVLPQAQATDIYLTALGIVLTVVYLLGSRHAAASTGLADGHRLGRSAAPLRGWNRRPDRRQQQLGDDVRRAPAGAALPHRADRRPRDRDHVLPAPLRRAVVVPGLAPLPARARARDRLLRRRLAADARRARRRRGGGSRAAGARPVRARQLGLLGPVRADASDRGRAHLQLAPRRRGRGRDRDRRHPSLLRRSPERLERGLVTTPGADRGDPVPRGERDRRAIRPRSPATRRATTSASCRTRTGSRRSAVARRS